MAILNLKLKKESHGSTDVDNLLDRNFSSFNQNSKEQDIKTLFTLYDEIYYDLPKQGEQSHTSLFVKSRFPPKLVLSSTRRTFFPAFDAVFAATYPAGPAPTTRISPG